MKRSALLLTSILLLFGSGSAAAAAPFEHWADLRTAISGWRLDSLRVARVQSLLIQREAGTVVFEEGRLALARPLGGRVCAAVFQGRGAFSYSPATVFEREQLHRVYGTSVLRRTFTQMVCVFTDSTLTELTSAATFAPETLGTLRRVWRELPAHLTDREGQVVRPLSLALSLVDADEGLFWGAMWSGKDDPLYLMIDPYARESVQLRRRPENDRRGLLQQYATEIVSQQLPAGEPDTAHTDVRPPYRALAYRIRARIGADRRANVEAELDVQAVGRDRTWLPFALHPRLRIESVSMAGRTLEFHQEKERNAVWVRVSPPLTPGTSITLRFRYRGEMFERGADDWWHAVDTRAWYPRSPFTQACTWDLHFEYPRGMQLVASGVPREASESGETRSARWVQSTPSEEASFDMGWFRGITVVADSLPPLTVWAHHVDGAGRLERRSLAELAASRRHDDRVALDVANAVLAMQRDWGPCMAPTLHAIETPNLRFEAYPGLIHLMPLENKRLPGAQYSPELYRYHEIAHQWWGLGVRPATGRDAWLGEGFASFASIDLPRRHLGQPAITASVLESWRREIEEHRGYRFGTLQAAGPIALGDRLESSSTPGDRQTILYMKSAWAMERLRCDLRAASGSDSMFVESLRRFHKQYAGLATRTDELRQMFEEVTGLDLRPFFRSCIEGTDPIRFSSCP